jgi:DNA-binding response OmpR family regulator
MSKTIGAVYEFGTFRLDSARRLLMQNDRTLTLPPKTFDLLILLVESRGRVFTKKDLPGVFGFEEREAAYEF